MISFERAGARATSASADTLTPALPAPIDSPTGGVLVAALMTKNNDVHATATAGWTMIDQQDSGAGFTASLWIARADSAAPVFTWAGAVACSAQVAYYEGPVDALVAAFSVGSGTANPHATAAIDTTRPNSRVIYVDVAAANTAIATPAGWTEDVDGGSATDGGRTAFGNKEVLASGGSSGAISITGAAAAWVQWQAELRESAAAAAEFGKLEAAAWLEPPTGAAFGKLEVGAWLFVPQTNFSKLEAGAWLTRPRRSGLTVMVN